jgi:serine/threonine-protein kinase
VLGSILVQAAKGLADAHGARAVDGSLLGLVHRDVSPHNILVGIDGHARIADFGIAHAVTRATATQTGELKGKLPYFSPEQVRCDEPDARSDVFSLGIVAWEMFAGQRLFDAPNPLATAQAVAAKPVPPLDTVRGDMPKVIAQVVRDALERDLDRRLESAERFANRLEDACKHSTGLASAREVEQTLRGLCGDSIARLECSLNLALATPTGAHRPLPLPLRARSKRPQLVIAAAVSLLLFAALAFALSFSPRSAPPELSRAAPANADLPSQLSQRAANDVPAARSADDAGVRGLDTRAHGSTAPASTSPPKSDSRRRATPRRAKTARAAARPDAPAPPAGGWLLRDISEFDRERTR